MKRTNPILPFDTFEEGFDAVFHERNEAIKTYWDFYHKSGILDYLANCMRSKYKIPKSLDPRIDYNSGVVSSEHGEYGEYDEEYSSWVISSPRKKSIEKDIKKVMQMLYLPSNSYNYLQYHFLYKKKYSESYPLYNFIDVALGVLTQEITDEYTGYTDEELKFIKFLIQFIYLKNRGLDITDLKDKTILDESNKVVAPIYKHLDKRSSVPRRHVRKLANVDEDSELVKQLRMYKKHRIELDEVTRKHVQVKVTSERLVEEILKEYSLKVVQSKRATIRKRIQRLQDKFLFLPDYILDKNLL